MFTVNAEKRVIKSIYRTSLAHNSNGIFRRNAMRIVHQCSYRRCVLFPTLQFKRLIWFDHNDCLSVLL